jgi:hypothetical protein
MKAELLEKEFAERRVPDGEGLVLRPPDALALVDRAAEEGVPILSVDGMYVSPPAAESPLENLADFSSAVAEGHGCWEAADAFIRARSTLGLVFELTLGDDPVEAV